jgi:hypothetical protein
VVTRGTRWITEPALAQEFYLEKEVDASAMEMVGYFDNCANFWYNPPEILRDRLLTPFDRLLESYFDKEFKGELPRNDPGNGIPIRQQSEDCITVGTSLKTGASWC